MWLKIIFVLASPIIEWGSTGWLECTCGHLRGLLNIYMAIIILSLTEKFIDTEYLFQV